MRIILKLFVSLPLPKYSFFIIIQIQYVRIIVLSRFSTLTQLEQVVNLSPKFSVIVAVIAVWDCLFNDLFGGRSSVPTRSGGVVHVFLALLLQFLLVIFELLYEGTVRMDLYNFQLTIFLLLLTRPKASLKPIFLLFMRYAITREALRDTPAIQCTRTLVLLVSVTSNSLAVSKKGDKSNDSWSMAGMYKYSMC